MMHHLYPAPQACVNESEIIDFHCPVVRDKAASLAAESASELELIEKTYVFVRDRIAHSIDCGGTAVTCRASEVLRTAEGLCYAKSHLLAALLRANGIAAGFCYQLLGLKDEHDQQRALHGLNAVWLKDRQTWRRMAGLAGGRLVQVTTGPTGCVAALSSLPGGGYWLLAANFSDKKQHLACPLPADAQGPARDVLSGQSVSMCRSLGTLS